VPQASDGKEGELSYGDEVPNDETTRVSIGCAAKVTIAWPAEVIVTQPAEVTVTQPMDITGTQPTEWSSSFMISLTWLSTKSLRKSLQQLPSISESQHGRITKMCLIHMCRAGLYSLGINSKGHNWYKKVT